MSATTVAAPEAPALVRDHGEAVQPARRSRPARVRPVGRSGRSLGPRARPAGFVPAPTLTPTTGLKARACVVDVAAAAPAPQPVARAVTRLTERGIAVVLVAGAMIVVAAVTVIALTAMRVTGDNAQPLSSSHAVQL
jgi:hypothetical protein